MAIQKDKSKNSEIKILSRKYGSLVAALLNGFYRAFGGS